MLNLCQQYEWLRHEYEHLVRADNPNKVGVQLAYDKSGKSPTSFINVLVSRISNGYYGTKTIMCNMASGRTVSKTILFNPQNEIVAALNSEQLTNRRCALMAVLSAENFFGEDHLRKAKVGLIGAGDINLSTAVALHDLFCITEFKFKTRSGKTKIDVSDLAKFTPVESFSDFSDCDVIFVATTETEEAAQASLASFSLEKDRVLFVTQDTGCLLNESFRLTIPSYTDDIGPLTEHWKECFPWDRFGPSDVRELKDLYRAEGHAAVYLYGMGFSDIVMACVAHEIDP